MSASTPSLPFASKPPVNGAGGGSGDGDGLAGEGARFSDFRLLHDVEVELTLEIGRRKMRIADVLKLAPGSTLELSKSAGEPLDVFINGQLLGRGEAVVVGDRYGLRLTELVGTGRKDNGK
jgi:flagellar motor switch protein FliN/FliY